MRKDDGTWAILAVFFCAALWATFEIVVDPAPSVRASMHERR